MKIKALLLVKLVLIVMIGVNAQSTANNFPASGNASLGTSNYLVNGRMHYQAYTVTNNIYNRGSIANNLYWDNANNVWTTSNSTNSDFGMVRFENGGLISFFSGSSTGSSQTFSNDDIEAYRRLTIKNNGYIGIGTNEPKSYLDIGTASNNVLSSILSRLPEGNTVGNGTYLGIRAINTQPINSNSFSIEYRFADNLNSSINFYRGSGYTGGFITFTTNNGTEQMRIDPNGKVGIGTINPLDKLHVIGSISANTSSSSASNGVTISAGNGNVAGSTNVNRLRFGGSDANATYFTIQGPGNIDYLTINNGNVGVSTTDTKGYKFAVNGSAIFTKAVVKSYSNWPDYVFNEDYSLTKLDSLENFLKIHKHLPDIPSATEVAQNGIDIGANQGVLLQKIEELTLYIINQNKEIELLKSEMKELQKQKR